MNAVLLNFQIILKTVFTVSFQGHSTLCLAVVEAFETGASLSLISTSSSEALSLDQEPYIRLA